MNGPANFIKTMPPWAKGVAGVALLGIAVALGLTIKNTIKTARDKKKSAETAKAASTELDTLAKNGVKPSYTQTQYKIWADALFECYNGYGTCTGDTIFVKMKNDADVLALVLAYGSRTISSGKWNVFVADTQGGLSVAIRSELSVSQIEALNKILSSKGIKYQF